MGKTVRWMKGAFVALAVSLLAIAWGVALPRAWAADTVPVSVEVAYGQSDARSMLPLINDFRTGNDAWYWNEDNSSKEYATNLEPLAYDYELERVAMQRAAEIALSFEHLRPDGQTYSYVMINGFYGAWGENLAVGSLSTKSAFVGWQEANEDYSGQGHRRNMLSSEFTCVGIGHATCNGCDYWVQVFGAPAINPVQTAADNSKRMVGVEVASSDITSRRAVPSKERIALTLGGSAALPSVTGGITLSATWPGYAVPIASSVGAWASANSGIAAVAGNKVVAKKAGSTTLKTTAVIAGQTISVSVPVTVSKKAQPLVAKAKAPVVKASKLKKKTQVISMKKAFSVSKAKGKVTFKKQSGNKKITVAADGKVTVKKGLKKGTYKVKVKISAKGTASYKAGSKTVTVKVKVK